jgi:CHAT domain-containing protein
LTGPDATLGNLVAELGRGADALAFVTHGVHDFARRRPAGLVLAPSLDDSDGVLWCEQIEERLEAPPIVALFACGTAFGPSRLGDDTATFLGNSFHLRGAEVVLLSRTRVEYGAMIALARSFLRHLAEGGLSPAEALRRARVELARSSRWGDVRHHGQIALHGLGLAPRPVQAASRASDSTTPARRRTSVVIALTAATVVVSIALIARARSRRRAGSSPIAERRHADR